MQLRRRATALAHLVVPIALFALGAGATPAGAQGADPASCDAAVVDTSGELDTAAVERAAAAEARATVVVRGYDEVPGGDLISAIDELVASCFTDANGVIQPTDLALISFSVQDRQSDVLLGRALPPDPASADVRDALADRFRQGDFTGGVEDAIAELTNQINAESPALPGDTGTGSTDPSSVPEADGTSSGGNGTLVAGGVLGGAAVLGAGTAATVLVGRRRRLNDERRAVAAALAEPRSRVGVLRERSQRVEAQADLWARTSAGRTLDVLEDQRRRARSALADTERGAALLSQATPQGVGAATAVQLADARDRLGALGAYLEANQGALDALVALGARLDHLRVALPEKRALLTGELGEAQVLADQRRGEGWKVDEPAAALAEVESTLSGLDLDDLALDLLSLSERVEAAEAALFAATHDLRSLPDRPGSIAAWRNEQREAAAMEEVRANEAAARLAQIAPLHATESWEWAAHHPDEALARLRAAADKADAAVALADDRQSFDEAGRGLEAAGLELMAADELLDQVEDLLVDLERAREQAPAMVAESRRVAGELARYVQDFAGDLGPDVSASPARVDAAIDGLEAELAGARPNHLRVAQTADRMNREIDGLLATARQQHEHMEALRRQAEREVARAQGAIARARQAVGWQIFGGSDGDELDLLERRLAGLPAAPEARFHEADAIADAALAVQERAIARRRRQSNWIVVGSTTGGWGSSGGHHHAGGGRSFGGGGSGGRSFGGGGGGGHSFGGGRSSGGW
ncbi:MAG: hypothetical protein R2761_13910 [Acidimicrobiales bacterium]